MLFNIKKALTSIFKCKSKYKKASLKRLQSLKTRKELHLALGADKLYSFHGGLHLELGKTLTNNQHPKKLKGEVEFYLLSTLQHKGNKPFPIVSELDEVKAGQNLTSQVIKGDLPIHSPVSGKVLAITDYLYANPITKTGQTIVIEAQQNFNSQKDLNKVANVSFNNFSPVSTKAEPIGTKVYDPLDFYSESSQKLLERITFSGIAGLGGAVFPSARKINNKNFKTLLVNACECEPYITCDDVLMQNYAEELSQALLASAYLLKTQQVIIAIEDDKPQAIKNLTAAIKNLKDNSLSKVKKLITEFDEVDFYSFIKSNKSKLLKAYTNLKVNLETNPQVEQSWAQDYLTSRFPNLNVNSQDIQSLDYQVVRWLSNYLLLSSIKIRVLPARYPSGNQRTTIEVLTGIKLSKKQNLTTMGAICFNIATIYSIYRSLRYGEVLSQRLVTITGRGVQKPGNYWLPFGITPAFILEEVGKSPEFTGKVIMGGPMMGFNLDNLNTPINKATNALIFVGESDIKDYPYAFREDEELSCIRCINCQLVCPVELQPQMLYWYERNQDNEKLLKANLNTCIECGACDYVCPSRIPLVSYFQSGKFRIYNEKIKQEKTKMLSVRTDAKNARDAQEKELREARRRKAKEATVAQQAKIAKETGIDPIAAAKARLAAKGITANQTKVIGDDKPDNSAIMEQRRLRREQQRKAKELQNQSNNIDPQATKSNLDKAAILASVAKAKARAANKDNVTPSSNSSTSNKTAILAAVAKAKAAQAKNTECETRTQASSNQKSAIAAAVARAKAAQAKAKEEASQNNEDKANASKTASSPTTIEPKKAAIVAAVARAKAAQAKAREEASQNNEDKANASKKASSPTTIEPKKAAIAAAVARAKAAQAKAREEALQNNEDKANTSTTTSNPANLDPKKATIAAAVAKAKATQAKAKEQALEKEEDKTNTSTTASTPDTLDPKKVAIAAAVARAKATQAKAKEQALEKEEVKTNTSTIASTPATLDPKKAAIAVAVARAKAKAAQTKDIKSQK